MSQKSVDGFFTTKDPARATDSTMLAALDNNQQRVLRNVNTRQNHLEFMSFLQRMRYGKLTTEDLCKLSVMLALNPETILYVPTTKE
jgi:hypothetical protein